MRSFFKLDLFFVYNKKMANVVYFSWTVGLLRQGGEENNTMDDGCMCDNMAHLPLTHSTHLKLI